MNFAACCVCLLFVLAAVYGVWVRWGDGSFDRKEAAVLAMLVGAAAVTFVYNFYRLTNRGD